MIKTSWNEKRQLLMVRKLLHDTIDSYYHSRTVEGEKLQRFWYDTYQSKLDEVALLLTEKSEQ